MLIKEYRIPLPLTVEEYRIAQLYMIAKKSREESKGTESGVEILVNEPYNDGPGGSGQFTHKIYHVGSHLPGWFKSLLPKSALTVEEEAWNAYPYTKTRFKCPFVEKWVWKFSKKKIEIWSLFSIFDLDVALKIAKYCYISLFETREPWYCSYVLENYVVRSLTDSLVKESNMHD